MPEPQLAYRAAMTIFLSMQPAVAMSDPVSVNYDEQKVPEYALPDPLIDSASRPVETPQDWQTRRRREIIRLFETHVYGRAPTQTPAQEFELKSDVRDALEGRAIRKEVAIHLQPCSAGVSLHLLLYLPKNERPAPVFLGLNFWGNQSIHADPEITLSEAWMRDNADIGVVNNRATEATRGCEAERWHVEHVLKRGYGVATIYYGDIDPDFDDGLKNGVHALYDLSGQENPAADEWGSISAWAWGLSRAMDYLETDPLVDAERVAVWGHSRLGKTALWAAAQDERFALAISNDSGCGGAALSRRRFGETVAHINSQFPHWFCRNFHRYNDKEDELPVDQHLLVALIAPRPVYVASAAEDLWADPRGEFLAVYHASPVYELLGKPGIKSDQMPALNEPVMTTVGYHNRTGKHDVTDYDWERYMDFADMHFGRK